jgi:putative RNA 2'-phosphotransferase
VSKKDLLKSGNLSRFMFYILGYRPYEFGLVPDPDGFIPYKELLKAINEEPGWSYVRQRNINEVLWGKERTLFQSDDNRIKATDRHWSLDLEHPVLSLPKILFIGIRRKAHPVVMEKGLRRIEGAYYVLSPECGMAKRIGMRRDQRPVLLEVMAGIAQKEGGLFYSFGDLFLVPEISVGYIAGPAVPKNIMKTRETKPVKIIATVPDFQAGTFLLDVKRDIDQTRRHSGKKKKGWKEEVRRLRRKGLGKPF